MSPKDQNARLLVTLYSIKLIEGHVGKMSKAYDFLKGCKRIFVAAVSDGAPSSKPFDAVMEYMGELYFTTAVDRRLITHQPVQIIAGKDGSNDWIRVGGSVVEVFDVDAKLAMLESYPFLTEHYGSRGYQHLALFKFREVKALLHTGNGVIELDS